MHVRSVASTSRSSSDKTVNRIRVTETTVPFVPMKQREIRETTIVSNSHTFWQRSKKIFERAHDEVLCFNFPKIHCSWIIILFSIARTRFVTFEKNGRFLFEQPPRHLAKVSCFATARAAVFFTIGEKKGGKKGTSKRAATTLLSQCGHEVDEAFHFH